MSWLEALLLGAVEGLTEFLPVSSTGHLEIANALLGHSDEASKTMSVVIQLGAAVAVAIYYRRILIGLVTGVFRREPDKIRLALALAVAFVPSAALGYLFHDLIKKKLFGPLPVAAALVVGGVVMIVVELVRRARKVEGESGLEKVTLGRALAVGIAQCASLWPGTSRSMSTIVGGQLSGLDTPTAAEFSFLLSVPILFAATLYDLKKDGAKLLAAPGGTLALAVGLLSAFVVSMLAITGFLRYLKRFGLLPFGIYRIIAGTVVVILATKGYFDAQ